MSDRYSDDILTEAWRLMAENQGLIIQLLSRQHAAAVEAKIRLGHIENGKHKYHEAALDAAPMMIDSIIAWLRDREAGKNEFVVGTYISRALKSWANRIMTHLKAYPNAPSELKASGLGYSMDDATEASIADSRDIGDQTAAEQIAAMLEADLLAASQKYVIDQYALKMVPMDIIAVSMGIKPGRVKCLFRSGMEGLQILGREVDDV